MSVGAVLDRHVDVSSRKRIERVFGPLSGVVDCYGAGIGVVSAFLGEG